MAIWLLYIYVGNGAEYTGEKDLLEYTVGDIAIDNLSNDTTNDYGQVMVSGFLLEPPSFVFKYTQQMWLLPLAATNNILEPRYVVNIVCYLSRSKLCSEENGFITW